jgi:peptidoglycan/xylan/chitin deacetylase (PgdA/CDA1 family)
VDALNAAVAAGKIPNIPQSSNTPGTNPQYPQGQDAAGSTICSSTYKCRAPGDIWDAPQGMIGTGFDDGPYPPSTKLYQFLQSQNQKATHFMIGTNILLNPSQFTFAHETLQDDIAVHTWTHPYMTTLGNLDIVAQLGWTMQLIHNSTGGRVTKYWRPPYGDADNRVRAIAKEVFGMDTILWNQDTGDWSVGQPGGTDAKAIASNLQKWITGPKSPGLIILEHELSDVAVQAFIDAYPAMKSNGWKLVSVAQMGPTGSAYQNANGTGPVTAKGILLADNGGSAASTSAASPAAASAGGSHSSSGAPASQTTHANGGIANWAGVSSMSFGMAVMAAVGLVA